MAPPTALPTAPRMALEVPLEVHMTVVLVVLVASVASRWLQWKVGKEVEAEVERMGMEGW